MSMVLFFVIFTHIVISGVSDIERLICEREQRFSAEGQLSLSKRIWITASVCNSRAAAFLVLFCLILPASPLEYSLSDTIITDEIRYLSSVNVLVAFALAIFFSSLLWGYLRIMIIMTKHLASHIMSKYL